jgi:hypothetical protein
MVRLSVAPAYFNARYTCGKVADLEISVVNYTQWLPPDTFSSLMRFTNVSSPPS